MDNSQPKKLEIPLLRRPRPRFSRHALSSLARSIYPKRVPARNIPRDVNLRVHLTMLQWFLHQELPKKFPQIFSPALILEPLPNQGWSNFAFLAHSSNRDYVVRMRADDSVITRIHKWAPYHKEERILQALQAKVPVPEVIGDGIGYVATATEVKEYAYFIQSYINFPSADTIAAHLDPLQFRHNLGVVAREINSIRCQGFGTEFNSESNSFIHQSWSDAVYQDIRDTTIDRLIAQGILTRAQASILTERFLTLTKLDFKPTLYHGDFVENWGNVLADRSGTVQGIIDWELAGAGPAPQMECALLLYMMIRDGRSKQQIERDFSAFLSGYGISEHDYRERYAYDVETIILLQALKKCNRYLDIDARGELREHVWRMRFFERCKALIGLGARLSAIGGRQILFSY
jgi:aminoglycoside phosphotransferase (APT) family kinase protein